jgi:hypothetical protein
MTIPSIRVFVFNLLRCSVPVWYRYATTTNLYRSAPHLCTVTAYLIPVHLVLVDLLQLVFCVQARLAQRSLAIPDRLFLRVGDESSLLG